MALHLDEEVSEGGENARSEGLEGVPALGNELLGSGGDGRLLLPWTAEPLTSNRSLATTSRSRQQHYAGRDAPPLRRAAHDGSHFRMRITRRK
jgi:hypothetical protein